MPSTATAGPISATKPKVAAAAVAARVAIEPVGQLMAPGMLAAQSLRQAGQLLVLEAFPNLNQIH